MTWVNVKRLTLVYKLMLSKLIPVSIIARISVTSQTHFFAVFRTEGGNEVSGAFREPPGPRRGYSPVCE